MIGFIKYSNICYRPSFFNSATIVVSEGFETAALPAIQGYPVRKRTKSKPITIVSLFSGCGGMDLGFIGGFDF